MEAGNGTSVNALRTAVDTYLGGQGRSSTNYSHVEHLYDDLHEYFGPAYKLELIAKSPDESTFSKKAFDHFDKEVNLENYYFSIAVTQFLLNPDRTIGDAISLYNQWIDWCTEA